MSSVRTATVTKANDSEEDEAISFDLLSIEIDRDEHGGNVTTAPIVVPAEAPKGSRPVHPRQLNNRQKLALEALSNCAAERGKPAPEAFGLPAGVTTITAQEWRDQLLDRGVLDNDAPNLRQDFKRLQEQLLARHLIAERGGLVWRCA
jgi:hypothetical protein